MGSFNKELIYRQGFLYLHYKNGDACEAKPEQKTETLISFMCDPKADKDDKPTVELTNDCTHFVTWKTSLACEAEVIFAGLNCCYKLRVHCLLFQKRIEYGCLLFTGRLSKTLLDCQIYHYKETLTVKLS